jgi:purine-nucleoside phosphorylase
MNYDAVDLARHYLADRIGATPDVAVIMGSGLSAVDEILTAATRTPYGSIPHFPVPRVAGHRGEVVYGKAGNMTVVVFEGRVHYYEGYTMEEVTFCTRVIGRLSTPTLLLTNAAGAIHPEFKSGQLMLISDHINFIGANPLRGPNDDRWGTRFVDLSNAYDDGLRAQLRAAAEYCDIHLNEGVYAAMNGPSYETPAEIRMLRTLGADCVGMSTVPEAIVARHMGLKVAGISMLTNSAAGLSDKPLDHEEVLEMAQQLNTDVGMLLQRFFETYGQ